MKTTLRLLLFYWAILFVCPFTLRGQFRNTFVHGFSDDHTSLIKNVNGLGYIQASTSLQTTHDVHLMKIDASGGVLLDKIFYSPSGDEYALDVCIGNNNTYLVCGYEHVGSLDLGFVMRVDSSFNFLNKVYIQAPGNTKHTPALKIINSAFYDQVTPGPYWPGDPSQGYLVVGFEADGYAPTQSKSAYAIKITNSLGIQWARKFDSPISAGTDDWDMCSNANWKWTGAYGYVIGGSGTAPSGEQAAMAALLTTSGAVVWSQLYSDSNSPGTFCVAADGAYDDAEFEFYQLVNFSGTQSGGIVAINEFTGAINMARTRYLISPNTNYYTYEFAASCASSQIYISGYGRNQTAGPISGTFPFILRYDKNAATIWPGVQRFAYPTQSVTYNPSSTIFDMFSTPAQPRIYYPKHLASRVVNVMSVAGFEDNGAIPESHLIHPYSDGKDSCNYIDPLIQPVPMNIFTYPVNNTLASYTLPGSTFSSNAVSYMVYSCCPADANFTYTTGTNCNYTFTATGPVTPCSGWIVTDMSNNMIASAPGTSFNFTFPSSGTYIVCHSACAMGNAGIPCRKESCQTITVTCPNPCSNMDADFSFSVSGCTVNFTDLTPEGNSFGCEYWTFGMNTVLAGDIVSYNFPGSGTYTVCHTDCCFNSADGQFYYHTVCKQVTVNCTPPCCLPTNWTRSVSNCCVSFAPVWGNGVCAFTNFFWNFGDGNVSNLSNPVHCYNGSGIYTVTLTAWCSKFQKITITKTIKVKCALPPPPPCCTGTSKISFSTNGLLLSARDASTYYADVTPTSYEWSWGDGTSSTGADAEHYYTNPGTYTLSHTVQFASSTGTSMSHTATQQITVNLSPVSLTTLQDPLVFASSPVQCSSSGHSTTLHAVDLEGRAGMTYQWMHSTSASGPFEDIPDAVGVQYWIENISAPSYFRCKAICNEIAAFSFSDVIEMTNEQMEATMSASPTNICVGGSSTLVVVSPDASAYEWYPFYNATASATVSPITTSAYEVLATNSEGCGALATATVTVDPCVIPPNDSPAAAINVAYSSNMNYPNCYPLIGDHSFGSNSPESVGSTGPDSWYRFVAQSTAVSITLNSPTADDMIELYEFSGAAYVLMPGGSENASSGPSDFERLNYQGLVPGNTYYVSVGAASGNGGAFTLCIQHLMRGGCASIPPLGGFSRCGNFKAIYRGSAAQGTSYDFHFTGIGGGAPLTTTSVTGTNGVVSLASPALQLRYGGIYAVQVDMMYALTNSAGSTELISVFGSSSSANCSPVMIQNQPAIEVRDSQRCPSVLLRSNFLVGRPVPGQGWPCGVTSYSYEFTQVMSCSDGTVFSGLPTEYTTVSATPFLPLGVLPLLSNTGAWRIRIRPNFSYGEGVYGPPQTISVAQTSGAMEYVDESLQQERMDSQLYDDVMIYPNPNRGDQFGLMMSLNNARYADINISDQSGRTIWSGRLSVQGNMNSQIEFESPLSAGVYMVNIVAGESLFVRKLVVQ